ncbi:MAG TPA: hypothetical protein VLA10_04980 [Ilumatobacter sp.]|nr:hypothetical protein [Ilumatobacter sp.]
MHGLGRFEGMLGSTSTKLARHAPCSVVRTLIVDRRYAMM